VLALLARQLHRPSVASGVGLDAGVLEHHREHRHGLPDRLLPQPAIVEHGDKRGDGGRVDRIERHRTEAGLQPAKRDPVRLHRPR
jgi:hypothetical protein